MTTLSIFVIAIVAIVVIGAPLEGLRQRRKLARRGIRSTGTTMLGAGLLELQGLLQPDRRVEIVQRQQKGEAIALAEEDADAGPAQP